MIMAEEATFKPLKEFGTITLSDSSEVRFYVDEYKGHSYASIRTFIKRESYAGPTKAGITMNPGILTDVLAALEKLPPEPVNTEDVELGRFPKRAGLELVARITIYHDATGVDLREWVDDGVYKGWSKKGVRIPYGELGPARKYLAEMLAFLKNRKPPDKKPDK